MPPASADPTERWIGVRRWIGPGLPQLTGGWGSRGSGGPAERCCEGGESRGVAPNSHAPGPTPLPTPPAPPWPPGPPDRRQARPPPGRCVPTQGRRKDKPTHIFLIGLFDIRGRTGGESRGEVPALDAGNRGHVPSVPARSALSRDNDGQWRWIPEGC